MTLEQEKSVLSICQQACTEIGLTETVGNMITQRSEKFRRNFLGLITDFGGYDYPSNFSILPVENQLKILCESFPELDGSYVPELAKRPLPEGAEGYLVVPKPFKVAKNYCQALDMMIQLLTTTQRFKNWSLDLPTQDNLLFLKKKTEQAHDNLNKQPGDFWVVAIQCGRRWAGNSVIRACGRAWQGYEPADLATHFIENEFALGPVEIATLLLTHPNRLTCSSQLRITCVGCDYRPQEKDNKKNEVLEFYWCDLFEGITDGAKGLIVLSSYSPVCVKESAGFVTGFIAT